MNFPIDVFSQKTIYQKNQTKLGYQKHEFVDFEQFFGFSVCCKAKKIVKKQ